MFVKHRRIKTILWASSIIWTSRNVRGIKKIIVVIFFTQRSRFRRWKALTKSKLSFRTPNSSIFPTLLEENWQYKKLKVWVAGNGWRGWGLYTPINLTPNKLDSPSTRDFQKIIPCMYISTWRLYVLCIF